MRELRTELSTLINTGHCNCHTTFDITLTDGEHLYLSSGEIHVNRFGKNQQYLARTRDVQELQMSLDVEVDGMDFAIENVDMVIGQLLTSAIRRLDGAEVLVGALFIQRGEPLTDAIWDAKMPTYLVTGEISDTVIQCALASVVDGVLISGRTIANEFQWQEPVSFIPASDPNDIPVGGPVAGEPLPVGRGRYGDFTDGAYMPILMP